MKKSSLPSVFSTSKNYHLVAIIAIALLSSLVFQNVECDRRGGSSSSILEDDLYDSNFDAGDLAESGSSGNVNSRSSSRGGSFSSGSGTSGSRISSSSSSNTVSNGIHRPVTETDTTGCPVAFEGKCSCRFQYPSSRYSSFLGYRSQTEVYVVNCAKAGFTNASVLMNLPEQTEILTFTDNDVKVLEPNVLGTKEYPKLKWVDMSGNNIQEIKGKAFHHVGAVEVLVLSHNVLSNKSIHDHSRVFSNFVNLRALFLTDAFNDEIWSLSDLAGIFAESNLTKLEKLHLEQNEMALIPNENLFCDLISLRELYLADNHLSDLNIQIECLKNLNYINLSGNQIRSITKSSALYKLLQQPTGSGDFLRIDLDENPFYCDCNLQPYIDWVKNMTKQNVDQVVKHEKLHCLDGVPATNKGLPLVSVDRTECQIIQISNLSSVTTTLVWILSFIVIVLVLALLYMNRKAVTHTVQPLLHTAVHGVKYTSIDKQEEQAEIAHV